MLGRLIALEPAQADLLKRICDSPLLGTDELSSAGAFTIAPEKSAPLKDESKSKTESESKSTGKSESRRKNKGKRESKSKRKSKTIRGRP